MQVTLAPHPANPARFDQRIDAALARAPDGALRLAYAIHGDIRALRVPTPRDPAPADALWRGTCCELFLGPAGQPGYREFNFSPSGQWAVYDFVDYRRRAPADPADEAACPAPARQARRTADLLRLDVALPPPALPAGEPLRLALAVVLEAADGSLGYWALAHAPGRPDFHQRHGFVLALGPRGFRAAPDIRRVSHTMSW